MLVVTELKLAGLEGVKMMVAEGLPAEGAIEESCQAKDPGTLAPKEEAEPPERTEWLRVWPKVMGEAEGNRRAGVALLTVTVMLEVTRP